jgi:hypothetical protein
LGNKFRSSSDDTRSTVIGYFSELGIPVVEGESLGPIIIQALRSVLNKYNVPFDMVHKRNGNYLALKAPDVGLVEYLQTRSLARRGRALTDALVKVSDLPKYLAGLKYHTIIGDGSAAIKVLVSDSEIKQ